MMRKCLILAVTLLSCATVPADAHWHHYRHRHSHHHRHFGHRFHRQYRHRYSHRHTELHSASHDMIVSRAASMGVPRSVIEVVAKRESGFQCSPHNPRYAGPLQIAYATARAFGFRGGSLNNCGAGLTYGLMHLRMCISKYGANPYAVAACHARGS